jgi:hypothetical protein
MSVYPPVVFPPSKFAIERVSPRYDASYALALRTRRILCPRSELRLYSSDPTSGIYIDDHDLLPTATETILYEGFNTSAIKDKNDNTYANIVDGMGPGVRDLVKYDFGKVVDAFVLMRAHSSNAETYSRALISNDDVSYSTLFEVVNATATLIARASFRYIKLQTEYVGAAGTAITAEASKYYSLEVYPLGNKNVQVEESGVKTVTAILRGYSSILEVITL